MAPICLTDGDAPVMVYEVKPLSAHRAARRKQLIAALLSSMVQSENVETLGPPNLGTYFAFKPTNFWEKWVAGQAALLMVRIDRNQRIERRVRDLAALRAIDCWEVDQAQLAERTAAKLATRPSEARAALWTSLAGCDWLLARWAELETDDIGGWTAEQRTLAHQIYPFESVRLSRPGTVADHLAQLREQRSRMVEADQVERALVEADLADHLGPAIREVRRVGRALERRLDWCLKELRTPVPQRLDREAFYPTFATSVAPATATPTTDDPKISQTNPIDNHENSQTNPIDNHENSQTNPTDDDHENSPTNPTEPAATADESQPDAETELATGATARLPVPIAGHRRRIDPGAELARERQAARRRA